MKKILCVGGFSPRGIQLLDLIRTYPECQVMLDFE